MDAWILNFILTAGRTATMKIVLKIKEFRLFGTLSYATVFGNQRRVWTQKWLMMLDLRVKIPDISLMAYD